MKNNTDKKVSDFVPKIIFPFLLPDPRENYFWNKKKKGEK